MATGGPVTELSEELTCPVCLDYFKDPVILTECSHSFCRVCLAAKSTCPACKQPSHPKDLRPNRQLANIVAIARKLSLQGGGEATKGEGREGICEKHREPLKLFCQDDEILICTVCDRSKGHKNHQVIPAEEASQECKNKIFNCLETLRTERKKILVYLADAEDESQKMLKITASERQKTVAELSKLHQLLKELENHLLAQIEEVEKEIARKRDDHLAQLSVELSSLESLIQEMEKQQHLPMCKLLQDIKSSLQRCKEKENFENPVAFSSDLKWKLRDCCDSVLSLGSVRKQFKDTLVSKFQVQKVANVTLDPTTANSQLILSEDRKSVKYRSQSQDLPEDSETVYAYVLGCEGFTAGCHFWQVSVGNEGSWVVGVAIKSLKGRVTFTPEKNIWAVGRSRGNYKAFIKDIYPSLTLHGELKRIRISLNCDEGQVAFFDADRAALLYRFYGVSLSGDTLHPFFAVKEKGYIRLYP